jgi:hypothetical protein
MADSRSAGQCGKVDYPRRVHQRHRRPGHSRFPRATRPIRRWRPALVCAESAHHADDRFCARDAADRAIGMATTRWSAPRCPRPLPTARKGRASGGTDCSSTPIAVTPACWPLRTRRGYATASSETAALTMLLAGTLLAPAPPDCPSPRIPATCCALASSLPLLLRTSTLVSEEVGFCFDRPARLQRPPDSGRS